MTRLNFEHFVFLLEECLHLDARWLEEHTCTPRRTQLTFGPSQLMFTCCDGLP
ncbi:hypothetical protein LOAG_15852, partial [Loa loa]